MSKISTIFLFTCFIAPVQLFAQNLSCGFDVYHDSNVEHWESDDVFNQRVLDYLHQENAGAKTQLVIPIVVHVVHQNGPENIGDAQVVAAVNQLNERLANSGSYFDPTGQDVGISVCLASVDPYGNATSGITHTVSSYTVLGSSPQATDLNLKNVIRWEPSLYLNVWVISSMALTMPGFAGYATFPSQAGNGYDGIVVEYTSFNGAILTHEFGHYLGLYHTFQGGCTNFNCEVNGDRVCDTPPDGSENFVCPDNSCATEMDDTTALNPFTGDEIDLPNYMDYTSCANTFTAGQVARMNGSLITVRSTLLQSNGCGQYPGGALPVASFDVGANNCYSYPFTNTSSNSVGAQWDFDGDGLPDQAGNTVWHSFPATGTYTVTMYAAGYGGIDSISQQIFVQAVPYQNYPLVNGFGGLVLSQNPGEFNFCPGATVQFSGASGMTSYQWSTGHTTQVLQFQPDSAFTISLTAIDANGLEWTSCYPISVGEVPAPQLTILPDNPIYCVGDEVTIHAELGYYMTSNSWADYTGSLNGFQGTDYTVTLGDTNWFLVQQTESTGCTTISDTLILIPDSVLCASIGLDEIQEFTFELYPNPASNAVTVHWSTLGETDIRILNAQGQLIRKHHPISGNVYDMDVRQLESGIYFIQLYTFGGQSRFQRLVIQ